MSEYSSAHTKPSPSAIDGNPSETPEELKRSMSSRAVRGDWDSFLKDYEQKPKLRKAALTQSQQTALHIAIAAGEDEIAMRLIAIAVTKDPIGKEITAIPESEDVQTKALGQKDERGDTALHLAAAMGMTNVCREIVEKSPQLIFYRNNEGETPIFLAASHGWEGTFFYFHSKACALRPIGTHQDSGYGERTDGNTMLHCAIANDKFRLALMVLMLYPNLTTSYNENGHTPLHILAKKSAAFKSGTPLGIMHRIFYSCIPVKNDEDYAEHLKKLQDMGSMDESTTPSLAEEMSDYFYGGKLKNMKQKHMLVEQIMVKLINVKSWSTYDFNEERHGNRFDGERTNLWATSSLPISDSSGSKKMVKESTKTLGEKEISDKMSKESAETQRSGTSYDSEKTKKEFGETPLLIAARMGVIEMVKAILEKFPHAISGKRVSDGKNALLLAVENRQIEVYDFLIMFMEKKKNHWKDVRKFQDIERNNPLHLAANRSQPHHQPWRMNGEAMKMLWEFNWYEYVKKSFPVNFTEARNASEKTPWEIFVEKREDQMRGVGDLREWMNKTSTYCSVVASLIVTVAYPSATTSPGDINDKGLPKFEEKYAFRIFMVFTMIAMCSSLSSLVMFLAVFITPYQDGYFDRRLLKKLVIGLHLLFLSIITILMSFFAGHSLFLWRGKNPVPKFVLAIVILYLPSVSLAILQFPLFPFLDLVLSGRRPRPWYRDNCL